MLLDVNGKRRKGACLLFRKEGGFLILVEEVSDDISFFIFKEGL